MGRVDHGLGVIVARFGYGANAARSRVTAADLLKLVQERRGELRELAGQLKAA